MTRAKLTHIRYHGSKEKFRGLGFKGGHGKERVHVHLQPPPAISVAVGRWGHRSFPRGQIPYKINQLLKKVEKNQWKLSAEEAALLKGLIRAAKEHGIKY